ncbi:hypothetical protein SORBI_3010G146350 [Sorghum bicolor]|uniref:Uncharacterized protein n=1 Tax=Sorghum bicolor TaxID=4558 RepID=A0A1W0VT44_SORBI|nr:hypothetical protein SORBI_3010G146350 [Sorghum bicolor]
MERPDSTSRRRRRGLLPRLRRQEQGPGGRVSLRSPSPTGTHPPKPTVLPLSYNSVSSAPDSLGFGVGCSSMATTQPNLVSRRSSPSTKLWFKLVNGGQIHGHSCEKGQIRSCSCEVDYIYLMLEYLYLASPVAHFFPPVGMHTNFYY